MNQSTLQPDVRRPRLNPRFAGVDRLLVIGVENLAQGISKGLIGLMVAGLFVILLAVGAWFAFNCSPMVRLWCYRWRRPVPPSVGNEIELVELGDHTPAQILPAPILPIQTYLWDASAACITPYLIRKKIWKIRDKLWYCMLVNNISI